MTYEKPHCKCTEINFNGTMIALRVTPNAGYQLKRTDEQGNVTYIDGYIQIPASAIDEIFPTIEAVLKEDNDNVSAV